MNMKKVIYVILLIFAISIMGTSCTKDTLDDRLVGTVWRCTKPVIDTRDGSIMGFQYYEFVSTTEVERYLKRNDVVVSSDGTFTYTLNYPKMIVTENKYGMVNSEEFAFTDSRTMYIYGTDTKFLRQ